MSGGAKLRLTAEAASDIFLKVQAGNTYPGKPRAKGQGNEADPKEAAIPYLHKAF